MAYQDFTDGNPLTAAQLDEMSKQGVLKYSTVAARDADTVLSSALREGMTCTVDSTDRRYVYTGSAWVPIGWYTSAGRIGGQWSRGTNQTIATSTGTDVLWDAETSDSDGFLTPTTATATIPAGLGGIYAATATVSWSALPGSGYVQIAASGGAQVMFPTVTAFTLSSASAPALPIAAGETVKVQVFHSNGSSLTLTASLWLTRIAA